MLHVILYAAKSTAIFRTLILIDLLSHSVCLRMPYTIFITLSMDAPHFPIPQEKAARSFKFDLFQASYNPTTAGTVFRSKAGP